MHKLMWIVKEKKYKKKKSSNSILIFNLSIKLMVLMVTISLV